MTDHDGITPQARRVEVRLWECPRCRRIFGSADGWCVTCGEKGGKYVDIKELAEMLKEMEETQREILEAVRQIAEIPGRRMEEGASEVFAWPRDAA